MSQPKLETGLIDLSGMVGDAVAAAATDGKVFTSDVRLKAFNDARKRWYNETIKSVDLNIFIKLYPEFVQLTSTAIAKSGSFFLKPTACRKAIECIDSDASVIIKEIRADMSYDAQYNPYSKFKGTAANQKFLDTQDGVQVLGGSTTNIKINQLLQPVDAVLGGANADIMEPAILVREIAEIAAEILMSELQEG